MTRYKEGSIEAWYRSRVEKLEEGVEEILHESGESGASLMRTMIEARGTGKEWSHAWGETERTASKPGRDDTGKMKNAVKYRVAPRANNRAQLRMGWVSGTRERYFMAQERGFTHNRTGEFIEGMFALQDSTEAMLIGLRKKIYLLTKRLK